MLPFKENQAKNIIVLKVKNTSSLSISLTELRNDICQTTLFSHMVHKQDNVTSTIGLNLCLGGIQSPIGCYDKPTI